MYTDAIFIQTGKGHQIPLQMLVSNHVVAWNELVISGKAFTALNCWAIFPWGRQDVSCLPNLKIGNGSCVSR